MSENRADITLVVGSTGSGKTLWLMARLRAMAARRVLVWDAMREYGSPFGASTAWLVDVLNWVKVGDARLLAYHPNLARELERQFDVFCGIALMMRGCVLVAEELSMVTKAGYSPARWREVITTGRHLGLSVIGTTQRPALVDKTIFSNATVIRVGRLNAAGDKKTMADALDLPLDELRALRPLDWIQKDMATGAVTRETLAVPGRSRRPKRGHT